MPSELLLSRVGDLTVDGGVQGTTETNYLDVDTPAGTPGNDELLAIRSIGRIRNDSNANQTVRHRLYYGNTPDSIGDFTTISLADGGATSRYFDASIIYLGGGATGSVQRSAMEHKQGGITSGNGLFSGGNDHNLCTDSSAIDSSIAQDLKMTATLSAANSELEYENCGVWICRESDGLVAGGCGLLDTDATPVTITTTGAQTLCSYTIPGGTLGTGNLIILQVYADWLNTSGATKQVWPDIWWGGVNVIDATAGVSIASDAARRSFMLEVWLGALGSTGTQVVALPGSSIGLSVGSGTTAGLSGGQSSNSMNHASVDSTVDQVLEVRGNISATPCEIRYTASTLSLHKAA